MRCTPEAPEPPPSRAGRLAAPPSARGPLRVTTACGPPVVGRHAPPTVAPIALLAISQRRASRHQARRRWPHENPARGIFRCEGRHPYRLPVAAPAGAGRPGSPRGAPAGPPQLAGTESRTASRSVRAGPLHRSSPRPRHLGAQPGLSGTARHVRPRWRPALRRPIAPIARRGRGATRGAPPARTAGLVHAAAARRRDGDPQLEPPLGPASVGPRAGPTASAAHQLVPHAPRASSTTPPSAPPASTLLAAPAAPTVASATGCGEVHEPLPTRAGQLAPPPSARAPRRATPTRGNRMENRRPHGAGRPAPSIVAAATPPRGAAGPLGDGAARPPSVAAGPPPSHHANSPAAARVAPLAAAKLAPERTGSTYGLHRPPPPSARPPWPLPPRTTRSRGAGTAAPRSPSAARCSPLRLTPLCAPHLPAAGALLRPSAAAVARGEPDP